MTGWIFVNYYHRNIESAENGSRLFFAGTALRAVLELGDYGGVAPVIPQFMRMRSIRIFENKLPPRRQAELKIVK